MKRWLPLFLLLCASPVGAATYYASPSGGASDSGTITDPFDKYAACAGNLIVTLADGDTVWLRGGHYDSLTQFGGGDYTAAWGPQVSGVTYKAYPGEEPFLRSHLSLDSLRSSVVYMSASRIVFDGLTFRGGARASFWVPGGGRDDTIRNCSFDSTPKANANPQSNSGIVGSPEGAIYMKGFVFEDNYFGPETGTPSGGGIQGYGWDSVIIRRNTFDNSRASLVIFHKSGNSGNRGNRIHDNIFLLRSNTTGVRGHCNADVDEFYVYNNIFVGGGGANGAVWLNYPRCIVAPTNHDSFFVYNNTFIRNGLSSDAIQISKGDNGSDELCNNFFIFNNLIYEPSNYSGITLINKVDDASWAEFGSNLYMDYNFWSAASTGYFLYAYRESSGSYSYYTQAEWITQAPIYDATWTGDDNGTVTTATDILTDPDNGDYTLDPAGSQFTTLSTGGRGGAWPSYIGALAPSGVACPTVILDTPVDDSTLEATQINIVADFTVDSTGDNPLIIQVYGEPTDVTPDVLIYTDTLTADSTGWTMDTTWKNLTEDLTYYWRINLTDSTCTVQSAVRSFLVDSIPLANTCPTVTLDLPTSNDTLTVDSTTVQADFLDTDGDTLIVQLYGGLVATPVTLVNTDTLIADSANWVSPYWGSLTEDDMHYWRLIVTDTGSCADTSNIDSFFVNAVADATPGDPNIIEGTTLEGVTIGQVKTIDLPRGVYERPESRRTYASRHRYLCSDLLTDIL